MNIPITVSFIPFRVPAAEVCPPGSYHKLKLALLLSLVNASVSMSSSNQETKAIDTTFSHSR